jgi:hypothetical protein
LTVAPLPVAPFHTNEPPMPNAGVALTLRVTDGAEHVKTAGVAIVITGAVVLRVTATVVDAVQPLDGVVTVTV